MGQDAGSGGPVGLEGRESIESILALRKLTRAVGEHVRAQMMEHLATLAPLLRPKVVLGDYIQGGPKEPARRADKAFKDLQQLYESIAPAKPFNLPRELTAPIDLPAVNLEVTPLEYVHVAQTDGQRREITVRAPLSWMLTYTGFQVSRLRELLDAKTRSISELQRAVLGHLVLHVVLQQQQSVAQLLEALHFPVTTYTVPELGSLPLVRIGTSVSTFRPSDSLLVQSAELTGVDAFEEVVKVSDLTGLRDTFKERLLEIAREQAPALLP
jgi:hypothetical protein